MSDDCDWTPYQWFLHDWGESVRQHPEQRSGQVAFNVLHASHPDVSNRIRGTVLDPFHDNDRMPLFLAAVQEWL